jgi:hypothetical protein
MNEKDLDRRAERLGLALDRRSLVKSALGVAGAVVAGVTIGTETEAARRGYSGPSFLDSNNGGATLTIVRDGYASIAYRYGPGGDQGDLTLKVINETYYDLTVVITPPHDNMIVRNLYAKWQEFVDIGSAGTILFHAFSQRTPDGPVDGPSERYEFPF